MDTNNFDLKVQAVLDKVKSLANFRKNLKEIEPKLPKLKIQGKLDTASTRRELNLKLKSVKPKVKIDADTTQAEEKIKKIGEQKTDTTITPTVDAEQAVSGLKKTQKQIKSLWERFSANIFGSNLIRMGTQKVIQAVHEAFRSLKELDTIKTNIQMISGTADSEVNSMMQSYNAMAKKLSSTTKEVGEAANELLRMGESVASANELIKNATILSKVGMIDSTDAASYLVSSMKGYQVSAEDSIDIVDKLTAVDLEAAVSAGGLAEAISKCSNTANNSGTSMNRLIGYAASLGEATQESMGVVGNSLESIYSRMNNIKIGRFIDDETGESLSDTEAVLSKLGIQLRDTEGTYRDFDDVLDDVGKDWENLTQKEQNAISVAIAGTMQRERFTTLMDNYSSALEYSEVAASSAGSALERYGVYQNSIEAKTNELTAALESLFTNIVSEELFSGIIQATTGLVEFLDNTNLLKTSLTGLVALGISKVIVSIGTGFITAAKSTVQLTAAMALLDKGKSKENLKAIGEACKGLLNQRLKLTLSTKDLTDQEKKNFVVGMGVENQERKQMLTTFGFAAAEDKAAASTFSLGTAFNNLKVAFASNPIGFIITSITTLVSIAGMAFSWFKQKKEEATQAFQDAITEYESAKSSLESINSELKEQNKKKDELLSKDKLTYAEKGQLEELQAITKELLFQQDIEERRVKKAEKDVAVKAVDAYKKQYGRYDKSEEDLQEQLSHKNSPIPEGEDDVLGIVAAYIRAQELLAQSQKEFDAAVENGEDTTWHAKNVQFYIDLVDDYRQALDDNITDLQELRAALEDEYGKAVEKRQKGIEQLTSSEVAVIEAYESIYNVMKMVYKYTDPNSWNGMEINDIFNTEGIEKTKDELIAMSKAGELSPETLEQYPKLNNAIKDSEIFLKNGQTAAEAFCDEISACADEVNTFTDTSGNDAPISSISSTFDQLNTRLKPTFDSLKSAYQNIFTDEGYRPDAVDIPMFDSIKSSIEEINKLEGVDINIDMGAFDTLVTTLADAGTTEEQARQAFSDFATSIFYASNATDGMTEETRELVEQLLESLGVINATEVAEYALAEAKAKEMLATYDVINAKDGEYAAILAEGAAAGIARQQLYSLMAAEIAFGNNDLSAEEKINKLKELATQYGDTASAALATAIANDLASGHTDVDSAVNDLMAQINAEVQRIDIDFGNVGGGSKSAGKAGKEAADAYLESFEKELKDLDDLKDRGKITEKQYLDALRRLYLKYFRDKEKYLKEYEKYEHQYLDGMKSLYESAFSYITKQIDRRIDAINDEKDAAISALEEQRDARLEEIEAEKEQYETEIEGIEEQIEAKEKEIKAMQDANEERKRSIDLQKAEYDLQRMQNQRTDLVYKDGQMSYQADTSGIRDAKQGVEDIKLEADISKIEKEINYLELEKELRQDKIDLLDKEAEKVNKYYDDIIAKTEQRYDAMIKGMEDYKSQFGELTGLLENAQMEAALSELGINMDALLSGSQEEFEKLKAAYVGILADMSRGNDGVLEQLSRLSGVSANSISYLDATRGAFENLGAVTLDGLEDSVDGVRESASGLTASAGEASAAVGGIQEGVSGISQSIAPLNTELEKLKNLVDEVVTLLGSIKFPEIGDEGYVQKLRDTASAFGDIALDCAEFSKIDFSAAIGTAASMGDGNAMTDGGTAPAGTGFIGLASAISDAVATIQGQMDSLSQALGIGNTSFDDQIKKITEEYLPAWEELQAGLAEIIGVGGGDGSDPGKKAGNRKPIRNSGGSEPGSNGGSIIDIMQTGGDEVASKLEDPWLKAFSDFATDGDRSIQSICEKIVEMVRKMADSIQDQCAAAANSLRALSETLESSGMPSVSVPVSGKTIPKHAEGTVGKALANDTGGYKGLSHDMKNALRSEYGQPELTVYSDGKAEFTTESAMGSLPKGTEIFNEEPTERIMGNEGKIIGGTFWDGTEYLKVTPLTEKVLPYPMTDLSYRMMQMFTENMEKEGFMFMNIIKELSGVAGDISRVSGAVNHNSSTMNRNEVNIGDIHLHEVQDVNTLSKQMLLRFPNKLLQEMHKQ